jgi:hypothetical protein
MEASKIYKNQKGHFPENIAALIPDILEEKDDDWPWREKSK